MDGTSGEKTVHPNNLGKTGSENADIPLDQKEQPGRRESTWFLGEPEDDDNMAGDDYGRAPRQAAESWREEREELRWRVERLSRDMELRSAREAARSEEELELHREVERMMSQKWGLPGPGDSGRPEEQAPMQPRLPLSPHGNLFHCGASHHGSGT
uniref:Uncharacterized protein n=1 Tax=Sphaerodactylus townsendi TaxID=933632 RepID=A0ACB8FTF3_9SAUR